MARSGNNMLLRGISGKVGDVVIKQYGNKTVITACPDMSAVKPSKKQKQANRKFALAVAYAKSLISDPVRSAQLKNKCKEGTLYHAAIREYYELTK
jgi:hypothetical protein